MNFFKSPILFAKKSMSCYSLIKAWKCCAKI